MARGISRSGAVAAAHNSAVRALPGSVLCGPTGPFLFCFRNITEVFIPRQASRRFAEICGLVGVASPWFLSWKMQSQRNLGKRVFRFRNRTRIFAQCERSDAKLRTLAPGCVGKRIVRCFRRAELSGPLGAAPLSERSRYFCLGMR